MPNRSVEVLDVVALTGNLLKRGLVYGPVGTILESLAPDVFEVAKAAWLEAARQSDKPIPSPTDRPVIYEAG